MEMSIGELAQKIIDEINPGVKIVSDDMRVRPLKSEVERLLGSNKKIIKLTGWKPEHDLERGLLETINWFRDAKNIINYKTMIYNI